MSNDNKAAITEKLHIFLSAIVNCESDGAGGYKVGIKNIAELRDTVQALQDANILTPVESSAEDDIKYFSLQTFELINLGFKFYGTLEELIKQNTYGLRSRIAGHAIDTHYVHEYKAVIPQPIFNDNQHSSYDNLFAVYALNEVLLFVSDDTTGNNDKTRDYTFFDKKKITISSQIDPQKIVDLDSTDRTIIYDLFMELKEQNGNDQKIRQVFFKSALEKVCETMKQVDMDFVITSLAGIASEYHSNYRAYLNSLDPSKIRMDFEKGSQEFIGKLSSALSDIHGKIILIPLAAIAAIYQISGDHPLKNFALAAAIGLVVWIVLRFSETQKSIVAQVKENIADFVKLYSMEAKEYSDFTQQISKKSASMQSLCDEIDLKIHFSQKIGWLSIILVFVSALWVSCHDQIIALWCFLTQCSLR